MAIVSMSGDSAGRATVNVDTPAPLFSDAVFHDIKFRLSETGRKSGATLTSVGLSIPPSRPSSSAPSRDALRWVLSVLGHSPCVILR